MFDRRTFLSGVGLGAARLALGSAGAQTPSLPGAPHHDVAAQGSPSSIMAIAAHPGDAFFAMGSAVAVQTHLGAGGVFLSLTRGEKGSPRIPVAEYANMQRDASDRAAQILGAKSIMLEHGDGELPENDEVKLAVCDVIREYTPAAVVTHWRGSWHKDHRACHDIVEDAIFYAGLPALARRKGPHNVRALYFAENWEDAAGFVADTYLDVTGVFERWTQACAAFPMWRGENGFRYNDYYTSLAVARGCLCGSDKAVALMSPPEQLTRKLGAI